MGTVSFLFTDIEGSTRLLREAGPGYPELLEVHRRLLREAFAVHGGLEVDTQGDSFFVVFPTPRQAVAAAVAAQRGLAAYPWPQGRAIRVRMGVHTGEATMVGGHYVGLEVHRAARIGASGHGGQVVLSEAMATLVRETLPPDTTIADLGQHLLKDFTRPERLYQLHVAGLPTQFPPLKTLAPPRHQPVPSASVLSAPSAAFVGRADELTQLRMLIGRERLVTLTGPGGIGKTRLALQLAAELAPELPDGAAFVSLAPLQDAHLVATTVAQALGVREEGRDDALEALKADLSNRKMLLVLDNFEQVLSATPVVTALLDAAPELRMVVTSRQALRVLVEHEFPVSSLPVADGVQLFAQRAGAVRHGFAVDDANIETLNGIVSALEGVPLAIELAAARIRILPPKAILDRLDRSLEFLTGGAGDLPDRQRALRATLDWSYDLLDDDDRRLLARLAVFAGSFSLSGVETVCDPEGTADVLAGLTSLVDKSLLRAEPSDQEPRFRMLVMVRDYAHEKLHAAGELEMVGRRHADFYRSLGLTLRQALRGAEQAAWVTRLSIGSGAGDIDNFRAALLWHTSHHEPDNVAQIVWSMWLLGWISGRLDECRWWARQALTIEGPLSPEGRARLLTVAGLMEMWKGDYATSLPALTEAVGIARSLSDDDLLANSLLGLSLVSSSVEGVEVARAQAEEATGLFRAHGDRWGQATSFSILTWFLVAQDDFASSGPVFEEALSIADELADELNHAMIETNVAEYRMHLGQCDEARRLLASSLRRYGRLRAFYPSSYAIDATARLAALTRRPQTAAALLGAADRVRETIGVPVEGVHRTRRQLLRTQLRGDLGEVAFGQMVAAGHELRYEEAIDAAVDAIRDNSATSRTQPPTTPPQSITEH